MYTPNSKEIKEFMTRGVTHVIPNDDLRAKLQRGERMRVYLGVDPTGAQIHLGHAVVLRKLAVMQKWGHEVIFLIGDFTAQIGDPTGRDVLRQSLTSEEIIENARDYKEQVSEIVKFSGDNPALLKYNSEWLDLLTLKDVIELAGKFTVQQFLERDMFQERIKKERPIGLHEFLYPLMVGYDCVNMDVDMEMGGNDQLFNIMAGRALMMNIKGKSKIVFTCELLEGSDGRKMSKSYGNVINITDDPDDMFGKIMSIKDELIGRYFYLCTDREIGEIREVGEKMKKGKLNPRDVKADLAREIVKMYHGEEKARAAESSFEQVFKKHELPEDIKEVSLPTGSVSIINILVLTGLASSKSDARRLVEGGGVRINQERVNGWKENIELKSGDVVQVGKRKFVQVA